MRGLKTALAPWALALTLTLSAGACVQVTINNLGAGDTASGPDAAAFVPPRATDSVTLVGNLDQTASATTWDPANPKGSANFSTSLAVYDSLGKAIQLDIFFCKNDQASTQAGDSGDWTYHVGTDGVNLATDENGNPATPGTCSQVAQGTLRFDMEGRLVSNTTVRNNFNPVGAVAPQVLTFNFGRETSAGGSGLDGLTQYAAPSAIRSMSQSGAPLIAYP